MSIDSAVYYRVSHPEIRNEVVGMTLPTGRQTAVLVDGKGQAREYRDDDGVTVADSRISEEIAEHLKKVGWRREVWEGGEPDLLYIDPITGQVAGRGNGAAQAEIDNLKSQMATLRLQVATIQNLLDRHFVDHASVTRVADTLPDAFVTTGGGLVEETEIVTPAAPQPKAPPKSRAQRRKEEEGEEDEVAPNAEALKALGQG